MSEWLELAPPWLGKIYLGATFILAVALVARGSVAQPVRRREIARAALLALFVWIGAATWSGVRRVEPEAARVVVETNLEAQRNTAVLCCDSCTQALVRLPRAEPSVHPSVSSGERLSQFAATLGAGAAAGCAAMLAWLALGAIASQRLIRGAHAVPAWMIKLLEEIAGPGQRLPRLLLSDLANQPLALGVRRPTIILPAHFAVAEPGVRIRAALEHEWAHLRGGDLAMVEMSRWLLPVLFAHPLYWILRGLMRADQESIADAAAARAGRVAYAEALLCWSRQLERPRRVASSVGLWDGRSTLDRRIRLVLDDSRSLEQRCPWCWSVAVRILAIAACSVLHAGLAPARDQAQTRTTTASPAIACEHPAAPGPVRVLACP